MKTMKIIEFSAKGHSNLLGLHRSTLEFTKDTELSLKGDCIIGVDSDFACQQLSDMVKVELKQDQKFQVILKNGNFSDEFTGYGNPELRLSHLTDMVFRKSSFICNRTIMISCSKAAKDINRDLINSLKDKNAQVEIAIYKILED